MDYKKTKDFLLCIDSDGCVMDAMDIKHIRAFGPALVEEWELQKYKEELLARWNEINLYSITRGINRFKGLVMLLGEVNEKYEKIEDFESILNWTKTATELSEKSIERELEKSESIGLKKALNWSKAVNQIIREIPKEEIRPFEGAYAAVSKMAKFCDIAVVSNANKEAIAGEWHRHGFTDYVNIIMAQDAGSKSDCIGRLLQFGYEPSKCIMVGDAKGDMEAAQKNGVFFYPIMVKKEKQSWSGFSKVVKEMIAGKLDAKLQQMLVDDFLHNLGA